MIFIGFHNGHRYGILFKIYCYIKRKELYQARSEAFRHQPLDKFSCLFSDSKARLNGQHCENFQTFSDEEKILMKFGLKQSAIDLS